VSIEKSVNDYMRDQTSICESIEAPKKEYANLVGSIGWGVTNPKIS